MSYEDADGRVEAGTNSVVEERRELECCGGTLIVAVPDDNPGIRIRVEMHALWCCAGPG